MNKVEFILMDIEGTTSSIDFVHQELFPYSYERMDNYLKDHPEIKAEPALLKQWIKEDKKEPLLKKVQGFIWQEGYEKGEIKGHVYDDVLPSFKLWKKLGLNLGIYSSGSVLAQKLLFKYSKDGDLTPYLSAYFDTQVGAKRETTSYLNIASVLKLKAENIFFLSDIKEELDAAAKAGFKVGQIIRKDNVILGQHSCFKDFLEIKELT
jgi:enolase-phosphatase E1